MGKGTRLPPPGPDDPIYKEGFTVYTPRSARGSTRPATPEDEPPKESKAKPGRHEQKGRRR